MAELLLGCGNKRDKVIYPVGKAVWTELVTLDNDPNCGADVEWDLARLPLPFEDERFDEIHAYHVLEHVGAQGDFRTFFAQFTEFWRLLKPDGVFCGIVPGPGSAWVWGDPGHTRFLPPEIFTFLSQAAYTKQVGVTALADYRRFYRADFEPAFQAIGEDESRQFMFVMRAVKPSRISV